MEVMGRLMDVDTDITDDLFGDQNEMFIIENQTLISKLEVFAS